MKASSTKSDKSLTPEGLEFWLSLEQYQNNASFAEMAEKEFLSSPLASEDGKDGIARREFLKIMGASMALATASCVRRPVQHIIPYAKAPMEVTPGEANFYSSTWYDGNEGHGLLVKTLEGRPIKLEGNPGHPMNQGALSVRAHAEVLDLYDPDRLKGPRRNLQNKTRTNRETISANWADADTEILKSLDKGEVAILSSTLPSPSTQALVSDFLKSYSGRWVQYDPLPYDTVREAQRLSYGRGVLPRYRLDRAKMVVSVGADFLGTYLSPVEFTRQWSKRREPGSEMIRLVMFESVMSLTGMNADDRVRIKPTQQLDVVMGLIHEIGVKLAKHPLAVNAKASAILQPYESSANRLGLDPHFFSKVAKELWDHRGSGLVLAGGLPTLTPEAIELQVAVNWLNSILGNDGQTIDHQTAPYLTQAGSSTDLVRLIEDMKADRVKTLVVHGFNPAYQLPSDSGFVEALKKVELVIYTGNRNDETGELAHYVLPAGNSLESWGDFELQEGLISLQQPTIRPMYDTRSLEESLWQWGSRSSKAPSRLKSGTKSWFEYLQAYWRSEVYPKAVEARGKSFDDFWVHTLQSGVTQLSGDRESTGRARDFSMDALKGRAMRASSGIELVLYPKIQMADGRYANVPWLQELPDPVTKIVWDNYLSVSPAMARRENLREGDVVELTVGDLSGRVPVHVQPGLHDEVVALAVGYGRKKAAGKVANGVGINAFELSSMNQGRVQFSGRSVSLKKTNSKYDLVSTQTHHVMEGRQIVVETTRTAWEKDPSSGIHRHKIFSIWPEHQYSKKKWAMAIDLNKCTGCSACVVACQSENNVPVVGKKYVMQGREMHWLRIDRYYKGEPENPEAVFQPMLCQQCETAPCETVCPVVATVHNEEGLNDMVYNRCVGTRYCSNNCPYKVRRFNWFNFSKREAPLHMALNPDVTVRERGVMEKCTFCVQRIRTHKLHERIESTASKTSVTRELQTACQQTCPAHAIDFGDLADSESRVSQLFKDPRTYAVLEEINTQPRVRYMSRVRNAERKTEAQDKHHSEKHPHQGDQA